MATVVAIDTMVQSDSDQPLLTGLNMTASISGQNGTSYEVTRWGRGLAVHRFYSQWSSLFVLNVHCLWHLASTNASELPAAAFEARGQRAAPSPKCSNTSPKCFRWPERGCITALCSHSTTPPAHTVHSVHPAENGFWQGAHNLSMMWKVVCSVSCNLVLFRHILDRAQLQNHYAKCNIHHAFHLFRNFWIALIMMTNRRLEKKPRKMKPPRMPPCEH